MATVSKSAAVLDYLAKHPDASRLGVVRAMADAGVHVTEAYVSTIKVRSKAASKKRGASKSRPVRKKAARPNPAKTRTARKKAADSASKPSSGASGSDYPRHALDKALRVPEAILEQNAGKPCSDKQSAQFCGVGFHGPFRVEISSALKYGLLSRPSKGHVQVTDLAKSIIRPQTEADKLNGLRQALLNAPRFSDVYKHYRGENIPDEPFFGNALVDSFSIPADKKDEFKELFLESLRTAELLEENGGKRRVIDVSQGAGVEARTDDTLKKLGRRVHIEEGDSCFVMMPFADPVGAYYRAVYEPAIKKAGLRPVRADDDMFATGKIIDQVWTGINAAKVLVAELTGRNPNVFYELGLAHALEKPVVLVSSNEDDVPFDVRHIRVVYYNMQDPFWGDKLIAKVAENILSALQNPQEAVLKQRPAS